MVFAVPEAAATPPDNTPTRAASPTLTALARDLDAGDRGALAAFWRHLDHAGAPLVEPDPDSPDHRIVTFVWRGDAHTRQVRALVNRIADHRCPHRGTLAHLPGSDVWHLSLRVRSDWRGSYQFVPDDDDTPLSDTEGDIEPASPTDPAGLQRWRRIFAHAVPDPRNTNRLPERWTATPSTHAQKSVVELPDAPAQPWWHASGAPAGEVTTHRVTSSILGNQRDVWLYTPPRSARGDTPGSRIERGTSDGRLPVLVLLDGDMWGRNLPIAPTLDNLIAAGEIPPLVAVLPDAVDLPTRRAELSCHAPFVDFLTDELLPWAARHQPVTDDPRHTLIAGQSLGGLTAVYATHHAPWRFGMAASASGSFWYAPTEAPDNQQGWLNRRLRESDQLPARVHLSAGAHEELLLRYNRELRDILRARGCPLRYTEFNGGHDYACWRGLLAEALRELLPGPTDQAGANAARSLPGRPTHAASRPLNSAVA